MTSDQIERRLFGRPGVVSVEPVSSLTRAVRQTLQDRLDILTIVEVIMVLLALLIAFNTTSISFDERSREHTTMLTFGMPVSIVMALAVIESVVVGVVGTTLGIVGGRALVTWFITGVLPRSIPDLALTNVVASSTYVTALVLGVLAVAVRRCSHAQARTHEHSRHTASDGVAGSGLSSAARERRGQDMDRSAIDELQMHGQDIPWLLQHWADAEARPPGADLGAVRRRRRDAGRTRSSSRPPATSRPGCATAASRSATRS